MKTPDDLDPMLADLAALMAERLELRPAPFVAMASKASPHLPRGLRRRMMALVEAQEVARNPRLAMTLDMATLSRAADDLRRHLRQIDVADRRYGRRLAMAGSISANLILIAGLLVVVLVWRGFV